MNIFLPRLAFRQQRNEEWKSGKHIWQSDRVDLKAYNEKAKNGDDNRLYTRRQNLPNNNETEAKRA